MKQLPIPPTYSIPEAKRLGYQSITTVFTKMEQELLASILLDMVGVDHCLIEIGGGLEVGRLKSELL